MQVCIYALASVVGISLVSLIGVFAFGIKKNWLKKSLIYLLSFSAGALLGDVFLHLLPETMAHSHGMHLEEIGLLILGGIVLSLIIEKILHRQHCHHLPSASHPHTFAKMNLLGDAVHNLIDGLIIGASFLMSIPAGIATTLAVLFHEIPQEIGDFAVLIHGWYSKKRALLLNLLTALSAILGVVIVLSLGHFGHDLQVILSPLAMGMFIYIAGSDLIPEMNKHDHRIGSALLQILCFLIGVGVMFALGKIGGHTH